MEDEPGDLQLFLVLNMETADCGGTPLNYPSAARLVHESVLGRSN
ncbi:MAG: hypothetical protein ABFD08_16805 [Syntrophomonas sp.]